MLIISSHRDFVFVGGNLSVDFSNTIKVVDGSKTDLLITSTSLHNWTQKLKLEVPFESIDRNFEHFICLRDLIHNCFQDFAYKRKIDVNNLKAFNNFIQQFGIHPHILPGVQNSLTLTYQSKQIDSPLLHHIVQSFFEVISDEFNLMRLKPCENEDCVLLFLDKSKNRTRRWCSMTICGNKIKASRFYKRNRHHL